MPLSRVPSSFTNATSISSPAANTVAITTASTERVRIDSSGNVGIGTSSPSRTLDVRGFVSSSDGTTRTEMVNGGGVGYVGTSTNHPLVIQTNNAERMRITSTGLVGIGTSSPSARLEVSSASSGQLLSLVKTVVSTGGANIFMQSDSGNSGTAVQFNWGAEAYTSGQGGGGTANAYPLVLFTNGAERMRITSTGTVGIGVTSPAQKLDVLGSVRLAFDGGSNYVEFESTNNYVGRNGTTGDTWLNTAGGTNIAFGIGGIEKARLNGSGEFVTGGTADQGSFNLQCNGTGVWGAGAYTNGSDARIKENITPIESGLDVVAKLNPVTYKYKEDWSKDQSTQTGFIAQELLTALEGKNYVDGVVQQGGQAGYYSVAYQNIIPILTKAIQELKAELDSVKAELQTLKGS
jgi:hypothetical protein